jgi:hypothetical protein
VPEELTDNETLQALVRESFFRPSGSFPVSPSHARNLLLNRSSGLAAGGMGIRNSYSLPEDPYAALAKAGTISAGGEVASLSSHFDLSPPRRQLRHPNVRVHILDIGHDFVPGNVEFHTEQRITAESYGLLVMKVLDSEWSALRAFRFRIQSLRPEAAVMVAV